MSGDLSTEFGTNIPLFEMIQSLRQELAASMTEARDRPLKFAVDKVDIELDVGVKCSKQVGGRLLFEVVSLSASSQRDKVITAKFKLSLTPVLDGKPGAGDQRVLVSDLVKGPAPGDHG